MDSWFIYTGFVIIISFTTILVGRFQRYTLSTVLLFVSIFGMLVGGILHHFTYTDNDNRTYNNYCRISAHSYSKGFEEGVRVTKEKHEQKQEP